MQSARGWILLLALASGGCGLRDSKTDVPITNTSPDQTAGQGTSATLDPASGSYGEAVKPTESGSPGTDATSGAGSAGRPSGPP